MVIKNGYYKPNIYVDYFRYESLDLPNEENLLEHPNNDNMYVIIFVMKGSMKISCENFNYRVKERSVFLIPNSRGLMLGTGKGEPLEYIIVSFYVSFLGLKEQSDMMRIFENKVGRTVNLNVESISGLLPALFDSLAYCLINKYGKAHIESRVLTLISELVLMYDNLKGEIKTDTDNKAIDIIRYIDTHYTDNISLKTVAEKFYISETTLNYIFKSYRRKTMWQYVLDKRLNDAVNMLGKGLTSAKEISILCGFKDYSSFYRLFKKKYGVTPDDMRKRKKTYWPTV